MKKIRQVFVVCLMVIMACNSIVYAKETSSTEYDNMTLEEKNNVVESIINENESTELNSVTTNSFNNSRDNINIVNDFLENSPEGNALEGKSLEEIKEFFAANTCGAAINNKNGQVTNPVTYLKNTKGKSTDSYSLTKSKIISGVGNTVCATYADKNNCTLISLFNIMKYYRGKGYSRIPSNNKTMYNKIKTQAKELGYVPWSGISQTKNDSLVKNTWRKGFGYTSGKGFNNYLWNFNTMKSAINSNKPFMFSMATNPYYDHTITVIGYKAYKNTRTKITYEFFVVYDGWSGSYRYLPGNNTGANYVACMTSVTAPSSKK